MKRFNYFFLNSYYDSYVNIFKQTHATLNDLKKLALQYNDMQVSKKYIRPLIRVTFANDLSRSIT